MDDELARLMTLVDHRGDTGAVEKWFEAVEKAYRNDDGPAENWDTFQARFYDAASSLDSTQVNWFLEKADAEFDDALRVIERFHTEVGPGRAAEAYGQAREQVGRDDGDAGAATALPDWDTFAAFLDRNDHDWQSTWPDSREWLAYTARQEGFGAEVESFEAYADAGWKLRDNLRAHQATPAAPVDSEPAIMPDWERFTAFITRNDHRWQDTWPESLKWLVHTARHDEGFGPEIDSFESHVKAGVPLRSILTHFGASLSEPVSVPVSDVDDRPETQRSRQPVTAQFDHFKTLPLDEQITALAALIEAT